MFSSGRLLRKSEQTISNPPIKRCGQCHNAFEPTTGERIVGLQPLFTALMVLPSDGIRCRHNSNGKGGCEKDDCTGKLPNFDSAPRCFEPLHEDVCTICLCDPRFLPKD